MDDSSSGTEGTRAVILAADQTRLPQNNMVASGGWCAPSETVHTLTDIACPEMLWDAPEIQLARGGLRFFKIPSLGVGSMTFVPAEAGVAALEGRLAENYGGMGTLHVPAGAAALMGCCNIAYVDGNRLSTLAGNCVIAGSGYSAADGGPDGAPAPPGTAWLCGQRVHEEGGMPVADVVSASLAALAAGEVVCVPGLEDAEAVERLAAAELGLREGAGAVLPPRYRAGAGADG
ncbi:major capsid protein [Streptomyces sp. NPDC093260]|uniref:major capsid protein n=1 Tax=Streptomyces sp. NPDC093260 TaxID=3155073 RepID=UPI0034283F2A